MLTSNQKKDVNKIMRKHPDRCSVCKCQFDDERITFTVFGYDKYRRMQITSGCCADVLLAPVLLGACGYFDPDKYNEILQDHPLASSFFKD